MTTAQTLSIGIQASDIITQMNGLFPALVGIVAFALGIPITFYVLRKIRGLVPGAGRH